MAAVIRRVACALSGGVDSAVAAALLKERGFDVVGVHMVNWDSVEEGTSECPRSQDEADAKAVCQSLGIHFHRVEFVRQYWNQVFLNMLENINKGRTVVSDVLCNRLIKFGVFHDFVLNELKVDAIATGHFARTSFGCFLENRGDDKAVRLLSAVDPLKDQTYFLSTLSQAQLKRSMFPVGAMTKREVRRRAELIGLHEVAKKPESMGVCFIGKRKNFSKFVDAYLEPAKGEILHVENGSFLGYHTGVHHFTIGKRIRLDPIIGQSPLGLFVASLDSVNQIVYACEGTNNAILFAREFVVSEPDWIAESPLNGESTVLEFRCQRNHPAFLCTVKRNAIRQLTVTPRNAVRAAAPGQMCVFYNGNECLGGGEVLHVLRTLAD